MNGRMLYHGSDRLFDRIDLSCSRDRRDFGRGFYTTTLREQAEGWARTVSTRYGGEGAFLYVFECRLESGLKIKTFDGLCAEWLETTKENRMAGGVRHTFDVVEGPVANDNTMPTLALYVDGTLGLDATLLQLS